MPETYLIHGVGDRERVRQDLRARLQSAYRAKRAHERGDRRHEAKLVQRDVDTLLDIWSTWLGPEKAPGDVFSELMIQQRAE